MILSAGDPAAMIPEDRLDEVAKLLAEAILRCRHRRLLKANPSGGTGENELEVIECSSAHGTKTMEIREPA